MGLGPTKPNDTSEDPKQHWYQLLNKAIKRPRRGPPPSNGGPPISSGEDPDLPVSGKTLLHHRPVPYGLTG